jgi:hypothetical protein
VITRLKSPTLKEQERLRGTRSDIFQNSYQSKLFTISAVLHRNQYIITMKKLILTAAIAGCLSFTTNFSVAQVRLNINIGSQPEWGPIGYDYVNYYYMPDINAYYSIPEHRYIYYQDNTWVHSPYLPTRYSNYDVYHGYKVVINDRDPWLRDNDYRARYANYRGRTGQVIIRDSKDEKYRKHWDKQMDKDEKKMRKQDEKERKHEDKAWKKDKE